MQLPKRKGPRLTGYDYSSENYYYVTICTYNKEYLFGLPDAPTDFGKIARLNLEQLPQRFANLKVERFVVMPNHIHAIIVLGCDEEKDGTVPSLSNVIGLYKSGVSRQIHELDKNLNVWQRSFYDRIIRDEKSYIEVCGYIDTNPQRWNKGDKDDY